MSRDELILRLDELLEFPPGTLTGAEKLEDLEKWDSLAMVGYMALVDEHFGIQLSPRQFVKLHYSRRFIGVGKGTGLIFRVRIWPGQQFEQLNITFPRS